MNILYKVWYDIFHVISEKLPEEDICVVKHCGTVEVEKQLLLLMVLVRAIRHCNHNLLVFMYYK